MPSFSGDQSLSSPRSDSDLPYSSSDSRIKQCRDGVSRLDGVHAPNLLGPILEEAIMGAGEEEEFPGPNSLADALQ